MKYCPKCKMMVNDGICPECKIDTKIIDDGDATVKLCEVNTATRELLLSVLKEQNVPSFYDNVAENLGMGFEEYAVFVPYKYFETAYDICKEIGVTPICDKYNVKFEFVEEFAENIEPTELEQMSPAKRTTVRVLSALLLIVVFCLVVWGTDYVMELIKNLFM